MAFTAVAWDEADFLERYPQFSGKITSEQFSALWEMAVTIVDNTESTVVPYDPDHGVYVRKIILYALMCHLATMSLWDANGQSGALTNASEGSVSAGFHIPAISAGGITAAWYNQTICGRTAWMLLRKYSLGGRYYGQNYVHPWG